MPDKIEEGILTYHEIFLSIQGESTDAGLPCVFIRLYGCNVRCSYCDQPQTTADKHRMSVHHIVQKAMSFGCKNVCITGGEPLIQSEAVYQLALELVADYDCKVSIETNGCVKIPDLYYPKNLKFIMDVKCPSSGVHRRNVLENLMFLRKWDEVKFVISDKEDYEYMKHILINYPTAAKILVSPVFIELGKNYVSPVSSKLTQWLLDDNMFGVRIQVQLHKILEVK